MIKVNLCTLCSFSPRLRLPPVQVSTKYPLILEKFKRDLLFVQESYNKHKHNPPSLRNLPRVASSIAWSRQLYEHISKPVQLFKKLPGLLNIPEARKVIYSYNRLAQVLVEYELVHLRNWQHRVPETKRSLESVVLVRDAESGYLIANFDPKINEFLREVQVLTSMAIQVPLSAEQLFAKRAICLENLNMVEVGCLICSEHKVHATSQAN